MTASPSDTNRLYDTDKSLDDSTPIVDRSIRDQYNDPRHVIQCCDSKGHYIATQSVLHTQAEMIAWLHRYVKEAGAS